MLYNCLMMFINVLIIIITISILCVFIHLLIKYIKHKNATVIYEDILLLKNYRIFNIDIIRQAGLNHHKNDHTLRFLILLLERDQLGNKRSKNPFRKMSDDEKYEAIKIFRSRHITNYIIYGCDEIPSDYLQRKVNKLKLQRDFGE